MGPVPPSTLANFDSMDFAMVRDGSQLSLIHTREIDVKDSGCSYECACGCGCPLEMRFGVGAVRRFADDDESPESFACNSSPKLYSSRVAAGAICRFQSTFSCRGVECSQCLGKVKGAGSFPSRFKTSYRLKSQKDVGFDCVELVYENGDHRVMLYIAPLGIRPWEYENVKLAYELSKGSNAGCFLLSAGNVLSACDFCRGFVAEVIDFGLLCDNALCSACANTASESCACCVCFYPVRMSYVKLCIPADSIAHIHCAEKCSGCGNNYVAYFPGIKQNKCC